MIRAPHTYSEWVEVLEMLKSKQSDQEVLAAMKSGTVEWQSGVAERFVTKLTDAVNSRMNAATDRFQKEISRTKGEERAIVQALLALRRELGFLLQCVDLPAIPQKDRQQYRRLIISQADSIQSSLEDSAKADRTGKLASIIRNNKVNSL